MKDKTECNECPRRNECHESFTDKQINILHLCCQIEKVVNKINK
jgi:hypothetical protein